MKQRHLHANLMYTIFFKISTQTRFTETR